MIGRPCPPTWSPMQSQLPRSPEDGCLSPGLPGKQVQDGARDYLIDLCYGTYGLSAFPWVPWVNLGFGGCGQFQEVSILQGPPYLPMLWSDVFQHSSGVLLQRVL